MNPSVAMAALILAPLAGAALAFVLPRFGRWLTLAAAAIAGASAVALARHVHDAGPVRHLVGGWGAPLGIDLWADGLSAWLLLVTTGVGVAVALYAAHYFAPPAGRAKMEATHQQQYFWPLFLFLWAGLNALFLSADLFNLYVTLELLGFAAVALVALAGGRAALNAALRYLFVSLAGSLFYLMGVALVYGAHSTVDLALLAEAVRPEPAAWTALALMTVGLMMKAAVLNRLDDKHRLVFVLRDIEGLSVRETADSLGLSEGNVKIRLLRARLQLREHLSPAYGTLFLGLNIS